VNVLSEVDLDHVPAEIHRVLRPCRDRGTDSFKPYVRSPEGGRSANRKGVRYFLASALRPQAVDTSEDSITLEPSGKPLAKEYRSLEVGDGVRSSKPETSLLAGMLPATHASCRSCSMHTVCGPEAGEGGAGDLPTAASTPRHGSRRPAPRAIAVGDPSYAPPRASWLPASRRTGPTSGR
jgi:hypothetical protein